MKTLTKAALAATVATGLFASPAFAAPSSANANFTANAKIVKAVTLVKNSDLDFGTITMLSTLTNQTVTVGQDNSRSCGGPDLTCVIPTQASAGFTVTGVPTQTLAVTLVAPTILKNAANDTVGFTADAPSTVLIPTGGSVVFGVGGALNVLSSTKDGTYTGNLTVTVTYQ